MKKRNVAVLTAMLCAGMTAGLFTGVNAKADGVKLVFAQDLDTGEKANLSLIHISCTGSFPSRNREETSG